MFGRSINAYNSNNFDILAGITHSINFYIELQRRKLINWCINKNAFLHPNKLPHRKAKQKLRPSRTAPNYSFCSENKHLKQNVFIEIAITF